MSDHTEMPEAIARKRVLTAREVSEFVSISVPHWRRMVANGDAPKPIKLGPRRVGWQIGTLVDWLDERRSRTNV